MFNNCTSLSSSKHLDIYIFEVSELSYLFNNCTSLTSFELSSSFIQPFERDTEINQYDYMFNNCTRLTKVDIFNIRFINKVNLQGFFNNCISLKSITFDQFYISKLQREFRDCYQRLGCHECACVVFVCRRR